VKAIDVHQQHAPAVEPGQACGQGNRGCALPRAAFLNHTGVSRGSLYRVSHGTSINTSNGITLVAGCQGPKEEKVAGRQSPSSCLPQPCVSLKVPGETEVSTKRAGGIQHLPAPFLCYRGWLGRLTRRTRSPDNEIGHNLAVSPGCAPRPLSQQAGPSLHSLHPPRQASPHRPHSPGIKRGDRP
jgi:hypothetical protein